MSNDRQLFYLYWPLLHDRFKQIGKRLSVLRDMQAAVIVQVHRRISKIAG